MKTWITIVNKHIRGVVERESQKKKKKKKKSEDFYKIFWQKFPFIWGNSVSGEKKLHDFEIIYKTIWVRDQHTSRLPALRMSLEILIKMPFLELNCWI